MNDNIFIVTAFILLAAGSLVNTQMPSDLQPYNQPNQRHNPLSRARRMYAMCPPEFQKIGNDCYFISTRKENWLDSHFECKDRNSKLAEPLKFSDRRLRKYLKNKDQTKGDKWIGGMYNWQKMQWQWGYNGGEMKYQSFNEFEPKDNLQFHCTTLNPEFDYQWSAKMCSERHYFICQHRMPYVNGKNRQKVYSKWNETYPNQLANEVEVYVATNGNNRSSHTYRPIPKRTRLNVSKFNQLNDQLPKTDESTPDYLPYSAYNNLEQMQQRPQEDVIHPIRSPHAVNPKQPSAKPKKRQSLKLTGEINLGMKKRRDRKKQKIQHVEVSSNSIDETVTNPGRHHHHPSTTMEPEVTTKIQETTSIIRELDPTTTKSTTTPSSVSENKRKIDEKALRRERLRQKIAALSPEEKQAFLLMKQQRAEARKNGANNTF